MLEKINFNDLLVTKENLKTVVKMNTLIDVADVFEFLDLDALFNDCDFDNLLIVRMHLAEINYAKSSIGMYFSSCIKNLDNDLLLNERLNKLCDSINNYKTECNNFYEYLELDNPYLFVFPQEEVIAAETTIKFHDLEDVEQLLPFFKSMENYRDVIEFPVVSLIGLPSFMIDTPTFICEKSDTMSAQLTIEYLIFDYYKAVVDFDTSSLSGILKNLIESIDELKDYMDYSKFTYVYLSELRG